ncbi:hypothetical protein GY45DRAFT_1349717 [Cubamyces sp. BRFM 1775]|nr:hypothetical protein GY45DRAFT_1349717 [Cubamyces sp. BRFM 1775]
MGYRRVSLILIPGFAQSAILERERVFRSSYLVLFQLYSEDGAGFNALRASCDIIENVFFSRFIGREHALLALRYGFRHLGSREALKELTKCIMRINEFTRAREVEFILTINTHADPATGGVFYAPLSVATLDALLDHVCDGIQFSRISRSMLFLLCCGGLVQHNSAEIKATNDRFNVTFAFDAPSLDPIFISNHFVTVILEFSVFGREEIWWSLNRSASSEVLSHTAVYAAIEGKMFRIRSAPKRRRPNGEDIRCCEQVPKYVKCSDTQVTFRCVCPGHQGARTFCIPLLLPEKDRRWILGEMGHSRYMIDIV